jgi:hypothetical protein
VPTGTLFEGLGHLLASAYEADTMLRRGLPKRLAWAETLAAEASSPSFRLFGSCAPNQWSGAESRHVFVGGTGTEGT